MIRIPAHASPLVSRAAHGMAAALAVLSLAGVVVPAGAFAAASKPAGPAQSVKASPEVNAAIQEAIRKAKVQKAAGGSTAGAPTAGAPAASEGANGQAFSKLMGEGEKEASSEEPEGQQQTKTKTAAASAGSASTGLLVLVFVIAALLLGGIAFYIVRDARSVAPAAQGLADSRPAGDQVARARKRRAKAKAARTARKRNR